MSWSRIQVQQLIDLYQKHACLYAVKDKFYKNKHARTEALRGICAEICKVRPGTSILEIKNKFNNLRTNFLAQYRKYINSFHSGMAGEEVCKPNIWYFEAMLFIVDHCIPRESVDSIIIPCKDNQDSPGEILDINSPGDSQFSTTIDETEEKIGLSEEVTEEFDFEVAESDFENQNNENVNIQSVHIFSPSGSSESRKTTLKPLNTPKAKKKKTDYENKLIETATSSLKDIKSAIINNSNPLLDAKESQSEVLGQFVAKQMSYIEKSNDELFLDVQHQISEIIYKARKSCPLN